MERTFARVLSGAILSLSLFVAGCGSGGGSGDGGNNGGGSNPPPPTQSNDASLSTISLSVGTLDPAFSTSIFSYTVTVANSVDSIDISVGTTHSGASYTINGGPSGVVALSVGENVVTIAVTAENGTSNNTYTLTVTREAPQLASIFLSLNTFLIIADGTSSPTLSIAFDDEIGGAIDGSTLSYELYANDAVQPTTEFTTLLAGDYALKIISGSIESNTVDVRARQQMSHATVEIPVIFHIVHFGEPIGTGTNLLASEVDDGLNSLNEAFSNQRGSNDPNAVDTNIRFRLAHFDPGGAPLAEPGIRRFDGTAYDDGSPFITSIDFANDQKFGPNEMWALRQQSFWDPRDYLNIWVATKSDTAVAQLPTMLSSNPLPGLRDYPSDYEPYSEDFGGLEVNNVNFAVNFVVTGPHEVGHVLGLLHPWSEGACGAGDYVDDTFNYLRDGANYPPCPNNLGIKESTTIMDYRGTRNTFSYSQRERMRHALQYGIWIRDLPNSTK